MKLRVSHYPQIPCKPFIIEVEDLKQAQLMHNALGKYDLFLYDSKYRSDYANSTFIEQWDEEEKEWLLWCDIETGIGDINEYFEKLDQINQHDIQTDINNFKFLCKTNIK